MKPARLTISLPKPCSENWDEMTPTEKGRFCASCQKEVIDFTILTDAEIIKIFKASKFKPVCGQVFDAQLNRELAEPRRDFFSAILLKRIAASLLFFQAIATNAWAQTTKPGTTQQAPGKKMKRKKATEPLVVEGRVVKANFENAPYPGVTVKIRGTNEKTITDELGCFRLLLSDSNTKFFCLVVCYANDPKHSVLTETILTYEWVSVGDVREGKEIVMRYVEDQSFPPYRGGVHFRVIPLDDTDDVVGHVPERGKGK